MTEPDSPSPEPVHELLRSIRRQLGRLTVCVIVMVLVLILLTASVYGELVNWFAGDPLVWGGTLVGAAFLGFGLGWLARRQR